MIDIGILTAEPAKVSADLEFLTDCFRDVLLEAGRDDVAACLPWTAQRAAPDADPSVEELAQASSIAFRLLTLVEQNATAAHRRATENDAGLAAVPSLWAATLRELRQQGLDGREIASGLAASRVEIVLTAHPTEAKRATVLEHYRRLYILLLRRDRAATESERGAIRDEITALLALLWLTGDIFLDKPDVASERRNAIHYLRNILPYAQGQVDVRLRQAWAAGGLDPELLAPEILPRFTAGTWVGGDRDGHPLVTADVTRESLLDLRLNALLLLHPQLTTLARAVSVSDLLQPPPAALRERVRDVAAELGDAGAAAIARNPGESWRQLVNLMIARLPIELGHAGHAALVEQPGRYATAAELLDDLRLLNASLHEAGAGRVARLAVEPATRTVQSVGFHLAALDVRQNSQFHDRALAQLLDAAGSDGAAFTEGDEASRRAIIERELADPRPLLRHGRAAGPEADAVLSCYRVLAAHVERFGADGLGALIVSMTRNVSDLLVVYLFAREAGLAHDGGDGVVCPLPVVPLFETIDDLRRSPAILREFLAHPVTRRGLAAITARAGGGAPVQQVMIGYSDSNKDGGIAASLWGLYRAQAELARTGADAGVRVRFFHGRGGTISRGAGPTHRFIKSLPDGSLAGDLRLTEQGETIAQKYGNRQTAAHNIELLLAGTARRALLDRRATPNAHPLESVIDRIAEYSFDVYTSLIGDEGFVDFFRQATPIDAIEQTRIGSRPARRTGSRTLADLRAIPWVFSWAQSRFLLSGWYGLGSALEAVENEAPGTMQHIAASLIKWAPLHYLFSNAATSVAVADVAIMREYAALTDDESLRARFMEPIAAEHERTRRMLERAYGGSLDERRPNIAAMIELRRDGLRRLHRQQVRLLRQWRAGEGDPRVLERRLLLVINAIAAGLGMTG